MTRSDAFRTVFIRDATRYFRHTGMSEEDSKESAVFLADLAEKIADRLAPEAR